MIVREKERRTEKNGERENDSERDRNEIERIRHEERTTRERYQITAIR